MNLGYTSRMLASRVKRWRFALTSLPARLRFKMGRASFVECSIARTDSEMTAILDSHGRPLDSRVLSRHTLAFRSPREGASGWALYAERLLEPARDRFASLQCAHCGYLYVIQIPHERPEFPGSIDRAAAPAVDFRADWFRFTPSTFDGPSDLACPHCEESAPPVVSHLHEP